MSNKVYTKKGDDGTTSLLSGKRIDKSDTLIHLVGELDELNSFVGLLKSKLKNKHSFLDEIQWNLFNAGSIIINDTNTELKNVTDADVRKLESEMDRMNEVLPVLKNFILPGGSETVSVAHICRTVCRRVERNLSKHGDNPIIAIYLNRLSDYFFVLARWITYDENLYETIWKNKL